MYANRPSEIEGASPLMSTPNPGALALPIQGPFPIQHLPLDILTEVFTHCLLEQFEHTTISPLNAPLSLCNVCSAWRSLAISTPELWRVFNLHFGFYVPSTRHVVDLIHMWIGRAGALPLTIKFGWNIGWNIIYGSFIRADSSTADRLGRIYNVLAGYASRWESVEISLPESMFPSLRQSDGAPLLRYLSISNGLYRGCKVPFLPAPRLTTLVISALQCKPSKMPTIPWNQLRVLRTSNGTSFPIALDLIKCCPRLEELMIPGISNRDSTGTRPHQPRIVHAALRDVSLGWMTDSRPFLDSLSLPALKRLSLCGPYSLELTELFDKSNCELEALCLTNSWFDPDEFQELLKHKSCKTLTRLCVKNDTEREMVDGELLVRLTYYEGETEEPLCPNLKRLTFKSCCTKRITPGLLGGMALSRCVGRAEAEQLQTLNFTAFFPLPLEDVELLKCAVSNGLQFRVMTANWRTKDNFI